MKKYNVLKVVASAVVVACVAAGCETEEKRSSSPVYDKINIEPQTIYTGQYAYATVSYKTPGSYIYSADYKYVVERGNSGTWTEISPTESEPHFKFQVPQNPGTYSLTFSATKINFSAIGPNGTLYGQADPVSTTFTVKRADIIDACWGDTKEHIDSVLGVKDSADLKVWTGKLQLGGYDNVDSIAATRTYAFTNNGLDRVTETMMYELKSTKQYVDSLDAFVEDSTQNCTAIYYMLGLTDIEMFDPDRSSAVLTGEAAEKLPFSEWTSYSTDKERAMVPNAFWNGSLEKFEYQLYSDKAHALVEIWCEGNMLMMRRTYTPLQ